MRSAISTMVTWAPKRAIAWPISTPMAPPPTTRSRSGTSSAATASRFVQCGTSANMGGTQARAPAASTSARRAEIVSPATSTVAGPVTRARPRTKRPPLPSKRSTATVSSQKSVASSRMRRATGDQSGVTTDEPAMPGMRRPSARRSAARTIILDGMQPQYGHSPPTSSASMPTTSRPASASPAGDLLAARTQADDDGIDLHRATAAPAGELDRRDDRRPHVELDLVVVARAGDRCGLPV